MAYIVLRLLLHSVAAPQRPDSITINLIPVVNLGPAVVQCGGTVTLNAGNAGSGYHWSDRSANQTLTISNSGIYSVTVTTVAGCSATGNDTVTINAVPVVNLGPPVTQCGGTATLDAGNSGAFYHWSDGSSSETLTVSSGGTYSVSVTTTTGCSVTSSDSVAINPIPTVNLGLPIVQCGGMATLDAGNAGSFFHWSNGHRMEL